jgi:hypothetical protein
MEARNPKTQKDRRVEPWAVFKLPFAGSGAIVTPGQHAPTSDSRQERFAFQK